MEKGVKVWREVNDRQSTEFARLSDRKEFEL